MVLPEDQQIFDRELPRILAMARVQLEDALLDVLSSPEFVLIIDARRMDSPQFQNFRGWLALFLDEPERERREGVSA